MARPGDPMPSGLVDCSWKHRPGQPDAALDGADVGRKLGNSFSLSSAGSEMGLLPRWDGGDGTLETRV